MSLIDYRSSSATQARWVPVLLLIVTVGLVGGAGWWGLRHLNSGRADASLSARMLHTIVPMTMDIVIKKDGELQAVKNTDIVCQVEGQSTIRTIAPEGSYVKKGDPLFELDSSEIRRQIQLAQLDVQNSESELTTAREQLAIQQSKNQADLEAARVELKLAQLDLEEYTKGKYPQQLSEAKRALQMAEFDLKQKQQALAQTQALYAKGFVTQSEVEKAQGESVKAQSEYEKRDTELMVLRDYTHQKEMADKENKLAQAENKVARVLSENASNLAQKQGQVQGREQALIIHRAALEHQEEQLARCTVTAPTDGIVIYGSSVSSMYYRETPIQPGAKVMEQQLVVRLPETSAMKAVARITEHQAVKLRVDKDNPMRAKVQIVGRPGTIGASITNMSVLSDNMQRWWNPELKEFPVDLVLDETPPGMKPGTTCSVDILVQRLRNVLAVPVGAVYTHGADTYVFSNEAGKLVPRKVKIGESNETHVQLVEGAEPGMQITLLEAGQGRELLGLPDEPPPATTQPADEEEPPAAPTGIAQVPADR